MKNLFNSKKAQLMQLEMKIFLIAFAIGFGVAIVLIAVLSLTGNLPSAVCGYICG